MIGPAARPVWEPTDFVRYRRFCPPDEIQRGADDYRAQSAARAVVVLSLDQQLNLYTLTFVAHDGGPTGRRSSAACSLTSRRLSTIPRPRVPRAGW